jgi:DNA-directed RNA polymerase specialized sigma24 family protein
MNLIPHGGVTASAVLAIPRVAGAEKGRAVKEEHVAVSGSGRGGVRVDLDAVFRRDYQLVVGVAARVLGSRDQAEDVAQEVFLAFGRSSVPAGEARGWLFVAAALDLSPASVGTTVRRAESALRKELIRDGSSD